MITRNLKATGLALCAAFAMSAVAAGSAWAETHQVVTGTGGTVHLTAEADPTSGGSQDFETTTGESKAIKCSEVQISGTAENGAQEVTVEPSYSGCGVWETEPAGTTVKIGLY